MNFETARAALCSVVGGEALRFRFLADSERLSAEEKEKYCSLIKVGPDQYELAREWYDGYLFGDTGIYCPWDVINYVDLLRAEPDAEPRPFWINTSGNDIIRSLLGRATQTTRQELQRLVEGGSMDRAISRELTYRELYSSIDNLWSVLYATGYLTVRERPRGEIFRLVIPNREIRQIYVKQIMEWIQEEASRDTPLLERLCAAFEAGAARGAEESFGTFLSRTISIRDSWAPRGRKENFYHGVLLGLLGYREDWAIFSNVGSGEGFSDILIESGELGIVIEVKYPDGGDLEKGCRAALEQIDKMGYEERLRQDGIGRVLKYGIACNRKKCRVRCGNKLLFPGKWGMIKKEALSEPDENIKIEEENMVQERDESER